MSQNIINTGQAANDGTGEPLRQAFTEINNNFSQIWSSGPVNSNVQITNNRITTLQTNQNLILAPNGIGEVQANTNIIPNTDHLRDLGSTTNRWDTVWTYNVTAQSVDVSGDVSIAGNVTVAGNIVEMGNIVTDTKTIQLANTAANAGTANGSGITVGANDNIATILYSSTSNTWVVNPGISLANIIITGNSILDINGLNINNGDLTHGSTSGLNIVANGNSNATVLYNTYGNIQLLTSSTGANVYNFEFGTNGNASFPGNLNLPGNVTGLYFVGNGSQLTGLPVAYSNAEAVAFGEEGWDGNIIPYGNNVYSLGSTGNRWANVIANKFVGDGSQLTGISRIANGTSNATIATSNGNVTVTAAGTNSWTFGTDGNLTVPGSIVGSGNLYIAPDANNPGGRLDVFLTTGPDIHIAGVGENLILGRDDTANVTIGVDGNVYIQANTATPHTWQFGGDSHLIVPGNIHAINTGFPFTSSIIDMTAGSSTVVVTLADNPFPDPVTGQVVISGVVGATEANNTWWYQAVETNAFQLYTDSTLSTPVDGSAWTAYVSGGLAVCAGYNDIAVRGGNVSLEAGTQSWTFNDLGGVVFPTLTVNLHNGGNQSAQTLQFGDPEQQAVITGPTPLNGSSAQRLIIQGQNGGTGEGGDVYLWAGDADTNGGDIKIYAGDADNGSTGTGGYINLDGGSGYDSGGGVTITGGQSSNGYGGAVNIYSGQGVQAGSIEIQPGYSSGAGAPGGNILLQGGYSQGNAGGTVTVRGGQSALGLPGYGNVLVQAAASTWTFDNTGTLTVPQNIHGSGALQLQGLANGNTTINIGSGVGGDIDMVSDLGNINLYTASNQPWIFGQDGNLTAPGAINVGNMSIGALPGYITADANTGIILNVSGPDGGFVVDYLKEDGNANTSGGELAFSSELGNATYRISLSDDLGNGFATKIWRFDGTGNLTIPGQINGTPNSSVALNAFDNGDTPVVQMINWNAGTGIPTTIVSAEVSQATITTGVNTMSPKGWAFENSGNLSTPGSIETPTIILDSGTGTITTVGGSSDLYIDPNNSAVGYIQIPTFHDGGEALTITNQFVNSDGIYIVTETGTFNFRGNGLIFPDSTTQTTAYTGATYGNSNVASFLADYGSNTVSTTGNITAGNISVVGSVAASYFLGNASQLTDVNAATIDVLNTNGLTTVFYPTFVENRDSAEIVRADVDLTYRTDTNTLAAGNITTGGTVSATGNIISSGNISGGNILSSSRVVATGDINGANIVASANVSAVDITLSGGAWTSYTPSWNAFNASPNIGNGTLTGRYRKVGKTVDVFISLVAGTTTTFGNGFWILSLPVTSRTTNNVILTGQFTYTGNYFEGVATNLAYPTQTDVCPYVNGQPVTDVAPINWGPGSTLVFSGTYEAA